jgi:cyclic pyranopterin phosphate synthase
MAIDRFGRRIHYLRISLTDHCNLRCIYCMPEDVAFRPIAELMQDDEIIRLVNLFAHLGFDKFRLTGGEPTVRSGIVELVREMRRITGVRALSMTTNGVLFSKLAEPLARAGLERVNFSLDTLDPDRFRQLTRRGSIGDVWAGIQAAEDAGLLPIKVNAVVTRGYSDDEIVDMARLTFQHPWQVRFIELMPFAGATEFQTLQVVSADEMITRIEAVLGALEPVNGDKLDGEARIFRLAGSRGTIGFINTITQPFCSTCTRARLTADGRLRLCLLCEDEVDLLTPMRSGASDGELRQLILDGIWRKPWGNRLQEGLIPLNRIMSEIGG